MDIVVAKIITAILLLLLPPTIGTVPYFTLVRGSTSVGSSGSRDKVIKYFNSLAGGVFLGALMLHVLAEGAEEFEAYKEGSGLDLDFPIFNLVVAGGFFMMTFVELIAHTYYKKDVHPADVGGAVTQTPGDRQSDVVSYEVKTESTTVAVQDTKLEPNSEVEGTQSPGGLRAVLLVIALSFHTIFDGLAIGAQMEEAEVWSVFAAVIIHKSVISFCLGLELYQSNKGKPWKAAIWLGIFTIMSPIGLGIGAGVTDGSLDELTTSLVSSILQALSAGTFLYVTFLEILCLFIGHNAEDTSILYLITAMFGFGVMAAAKAFD